MGPATTGTTTASPGSASPGAIAGLLLALVCAGPAAGQGFDATPRPPERLAARCIPLREEPGVVEEILRRCRVKAFAKLGVVDGRAVHYALYRYVELSPEELADTSFLEIREDHPFNHTAVVLFEGPPDGGPLTPFWADAEAEFGVSYFEADEETVVEVEIVPPGHTIQFPKQPVQGGVGGNPWIYAQFEQGGIQSGMRP